MNLEEFLKKLFEEEIERHKDLIPIRADRFFEAIRKAMEFERAACADLKRHHVQAIAAYQRAAGDQEIDADRVSKTQYDGRSSTCPVCNDFGMHKCSIHRLV